MSVIGVPVFRLEEGEMRLSVAKEMQSSRCPLWLAFNQYRLLLFLAPSRAGSQPQARAAARNLAHHAHDAHVKVNSGAGGVGWVSRAVCVWARAIRSAPANQEVPGRPYGCGVCTISFASSFLVRLVLALSSSLLSICLPVSFSLYPAVSICLYFICPLLSSSRPCPLLFSSLYLPLLNGL